MKASAKQEWECLHNLKILQSVFQDCAIRKVSSFKWRFAGIWFHIWGFQKCWEILNSSHPYNVMDSVRFFFKCLLIFETFSNSVKPSFSCSRPAAHRYRQTREMYVFGQSRIPPVDEMLLWPVRWFFSHKAARCRNSGNDYPDSTPAPPSGPPSRPAFPVLSRPSSSSQSRLTSGQISAPSRHPERTRPFTSSSSTRLMGSPPRLASGTRPTGRRDNDEVPKLKEALDESEKKETSLGCNFF